MQPSNLIGSLLTGINREITTNILDEHERLFGKKFRDLIAAYKKLPLRTAHSDQMNARHDAARIALILECLHFLKVYHNIGQKMIADSNTPEAKLCQEGLTIFHKRQLFITVTQLIFNASGEFKNTYKKYLSPAPFAWETFEHFGAAMKNHTHKSVTIFHQSFTLESLESIRMEYYDKELIIESATDKIITHDLNNLIDFFKMIKAHHVDKNPSIVLQPYQFLAIKAITKRILDVDSLMKLFNLTNNYVLSREEIKQLDLKSTTPNDFTPSLLIFNSNRPVPRLNINSKLLVHATLRRLELIGELLTGKYFSTAWKNDDDTIDWAAFSTLRDAIAHQDEGDNYAKLQKFISDNTLLNNIIQQDLPYFHERLELLCVKKTHTEIAYERTKEDQFCDAIIVDENKLFQQSLLQNNAPKPPEEKLKLTKQERTQRRENEIKAAADRQQAIRDKYKGLESLRKAADFFSSTINPNDVLNPKKRLELAMEALTNIKEFLLNDAKVTLTQATSIDTILTALDSSEFLNDAINYNIEQFLQHLDRIKDYDVIKTQSFIRNEYDTLRYLRNHITHGALLLDTEEIRQGQEAPRYSLQQKYVAIGLKSFILGFIPILKAAIQHQNTRPSVRASMT